MRTSINHSIGVELEFYSPEEDIDGVGEDLSVGLQSFPTAAPVFVNLHDSRGTMIPRQFQESGNYWNVKFDGSCGLEITTPPLTNENAAHLAVACRVARENGEVNRNCGTHVHHSFPNDNLDDMVKLMRFWWHYEPLIARLVSGSRRDNRFCRLFTRTFDSSRFHNYIEQSRSTEWLCGSFDRYQSLNVTHWWRTGRMEIRLHHGTLNAKRIWSWGHFTQHLLHAGKAFEGPFSSLTPPASLENPAARLDELLELFSASSRRERRYFRRMLAERFIKYNSLSTEQVAALRGV